MKKHPQLHILRVWGCFFVSTYEYYALKKLREVVKVKKVLLRYISK